MLYNLSIYNAYDLSEWLKVLWHGLPLDCSLAGYLTVIPGLSLIASVWTKHDGSTFRRLYFLLASWLVIILSILNAVLYGYWRFPLDTTPFFYFISSPSDAMASAGWDEYAVMVLLVFLFIISVWITVKTKRHEESNNYTHHRIATTIALLILTALLFIPIRGGVTVSTMNTGEVYFSENEALNHAAVNPVFSLMESASKQKDFGSQYRLMDDAQATHIFREMTSTSSDSTKKILTISRPDVYIIVMESFSRLVMQTDATPNLNKLAKEGVLFDNFYGNSFRTDRGLVSVLSGFPAQPTMSIMKYPAKTRHLPSIARSMRKVGYSAKYYYGGDADFCNQRSYLISQGFQRIIADKSFLLKYRLSKWGVPDGPLFERVEKDLAKNATPSPMLLVIQTSSSHEPFDVPVNLNRDKRLNAFAYADQQIGEFIYYLKRSGRWERSLVVLVADHLGAWPEKIDLGRLDRFQIPLILTGGAVRSPLRQTVYGSQQDIAATLLGQLGIPHNDFLFSKDLLNPSIPHFAFFTYPEAFGIADEQNQLIYDLNTNHIVLDTGQDKGKNILAGKAYLQKLYDVINQL
ncbi:MAG: LTA synthase family protein [Prevotella sp.]